MSFNSLFRKKSIQQVMQNASDNEANGMNKVLGVRDLTLLAIAAIVGAGIFSTVGKACAEGGPAISLLYVFTAVACLFSALCYAEFASRIPVSGSAYTYAYTTLGEIIAWIIGWNLVFEYAVGNITVAISWSDYFTTLLENGLKINVPDYFELDYLSASRAFTEVQNQLAAGVARESISSALLTAANAWETAPQIAGLRIIADLPTLIITIFTTILIIRGMKESRNVSNAMVIVKMAVILIVISIGIFYIDVENWQPFAPKGYGSILKGVSAVFFAYIGFDAISTTAEECKDPQRDLPRAMIYSLIICTIIYVVMVLTMTGMVKYDLLNVGDPLAFVFGKVGLPWVEKIVAVSAIFAMGSVFLVFQIGQPRIWMAMSRDGLLPKRFASLHPKYKTPYFSSILAGIIVAVPSLFMNLTEVTDLCSIGTLFAFALVSGGLLFLERDDNAKGFKVPYFNSAFVTPILLVLVFLFFWTSKQDIFSYDAFVSFKAEGGDTAAQSMSQFIKHGFLYWGYLAAFVAVAYFGFKQKWSLIPVVGFLINLYLMTELGITNWTRFLIWCAIGVVIYFAYSRKHSKLAKQ
jgi:basic amino acid/polyamine antiporter, APA family